MLALVEEGLAGKDLTGVDVAICEEFTDPPEHLLVDGAETIGWHLRVVDGVVRVGRTPINDADFKLIGDYDALLPLARRTTAENAEVDDWEKAVAAGKARVEGSVDAFGLIAALDLHDLMAARTA